MSQKPRTTAGVNITSCSVRVLKSFDYCHFEVALTAQGGMTMQGWVMPSLPPVITLADIDGLRKEAARLADKAVEQYKLKKKALEIGLSYTYHNLCDEAAKIELMPENERSEEHKAILKKVGDLRHAQKYDYEDDFPSMEDDE